MLQKVYKKNCTSEARLKGLNFEGIKSIKKSLIGIKNTGGRLRYKNRSGEHSVPEGAPATGFWNVFCREVFFIDLSENYFKD